MSEKAIINIVKVVLVVSFFSLEQLTQLCVGEIVSVDGHVASEMGKLDRE